MSILTRRLSNIARRLSSTDPNSNSNSELSPSNKKTAQEEAQNSCNDFLKLIERFDSLIQEPNSYISSELDELKLRVERKRDELKLIIDKEANKLTSWLDEFKDELIDEVNTDKLKLENSAAIEEARLKQEELAEKLDGSKKLSDSGAKELAKSCEEWSTKLTGSIDAVKGQLMTRKYAEKCEVVNRFAKVNISANLCFWKIHSQIIHINYQSDFFKSCGFQVGQNWDLLYRSSGSEYSGHELLSQCTGKSPLLVIVRTHNGIITGGYTESRWDQRAKKSSDSRALVFRKSPHEKQFELFRRDGSSPYEVNCDPNSGPCFYGAYGLKITNDSAVFLFRSSVNESDRFMIDSIECFRKVKKRVDFYEKDVNGAAENVPKSTYKDIRANLKNWG